MISIIGTLRADRMKEVPISSKKEVQARKKSNQSTEKAVVVWKDNGAVIITSNCFGSETIQKVKR